MSNEGKFDLTIKLPLSHHWYDETESGRKRVEYRRMSNHWRKLLWDKRGMISHVRFQRGFQTPIRQITFEVERIDVGDCPIDGWDDKYYRIYFK